MAGRVTAGLSRAVSTASLLARAAERRRVQYAAADDRRAVRREFAREAFFMLAGHFTPTIEARWPSGRYLVSTADRDVSRRTYVSGPYALDTLLSAARLIERETGGRVGGREVLEIGANIGTTTVPLITALGASHVHAFEPGPANLALLEHNLIANGLGERVTVHPIALSDHVGSLPFVGDGPPSGSAHVARDGEAGRAVPCATVDRLAADGRIAVERLALVWIDVEGHEAAVLAGAACLRSVPVVIEYQPSLHRGLRELIGLVEQRRGRTLDLRADGREVRVAALGDRPTDLLLLPGPERAFRPYV